MFKSILHILPIAILILKCNAQNNDTKSKDVNHKIEVVHTKWVLQGIEDPYQKDSIPLTDIVAKKILEFKSDTVTEYFYPFNKISQFYLFDKDSKLIYSKSNNKLIKEYEYKLVNDSLVLTKQGRHGMVKEYYSIFKEN